MEIINKELGELIINHLSKIGENKEKFLAEGWTIIEESDVKEESEETILAIQQKPKIGSLKDSRNIAVRYEYTGPQDGRNRDFCARMMALPNRLFRKEDINQMSFSTENKDFGTYSIFKYKGSYGCRHYWKRLLFEKKGVIITNNKRGGQGTPMDAADRIATRLKKYLNNNNKIDDLIIAKVKFVEGSISIMSLVEYPASQINFLRLNNEDEIQDKLLLSIDLEKKEIYGPALIPGKKYTRGPNYFKNMKIPTKTGGYIYFDEETVKLIAIEYLNHCDLSLNLDHNILVDKNKYEIVASTFIESENDKAYSYFNQDDLSNGTWMLHYRILDDEIWTDIKRGKYRGFSIQGDPEIVIMNEKIKLELKNELLNNYLSDELADIMFDILKKNN